MTRHTPLAELIQTRMKELGLTQEALGRRLGYSNTAKAAGRVYALCNDKPFSTKSLAALRRLPEALELSSATIEEAVSATEQLFSARAREAEDQRRAAQKAEDAAWRAAFRPHAVILTEHTVPTQITMCALTGGAGVRLIIPIDASKPPLTFINQAVAGLKEHFREPGNGPIGILFFGRALGLIINYAPDQAIRCDLDGTPREVLTKAYRLGEARFSPG